MIIICHNLEEMLELKGLMVIVESKQYPALPASKNAFSGQVKTHTISVQSEMRPNHVIIMLYSQEVFRDGWTRFLVSNLKSLADRAAYFVALPVQITQGLHTS